MESADTSLKSRASEAVQENGPQEVKVSHDDHDDTQTEQREEKNGQQTSLTFTLNDKPPLLITIFFSLQQALMTFGGPLTAAYIIHRQVCGEGDHVFFAELLSTTLVMCGVCTLLQCIIGIRIPVVQSSCFSFFPPIIAMMSLEQWRCDAGSKTVNATIRVNTTQDINITATGGADLSAEWMPRMQVISGALIGASLVQVFLGMTGVMGFLMRFIGPLTITPTVALVGLSLFKAVSSAMETHWGISMMTACLVLLFSLYLGRLLLPFPTFSRQRGFHWGRLPVFRLFPTALAIGLTWLTCYILTATGQLTSDPTLPEFRARTDAKMDAVYQSKWFYMPYPGQWGMPQFNASVFIGMLAATASSIIDSMGDYYATARVCALPPPPRHAMNRGIALEGLGGVLCGLFGVGHSTTSHSGVIGFICITGVASRWIWLWMSFALILCGIIGKVGAVLSTIPEPVIGGLNLILMSMIISVALSNLQSVDLDSSRNLTILGVSIFSGLVVPFWLQEHKNAIQTGSLVLDQVITVFLSTAMFVGGVVGLVLDNTVPGTKEERGLIPFLKSMETADGQDRPELKIYDIPYITPFLKRTRFMENMPFLPSYRDNGLSCYRKCRRKNKSSGDKSDQKLFS